MLSRTLRPLFFFAFVLTGFAQQPTPTPTAPPAEKFEQEILAFEAQDAAQPPEKGAILFVGSSSIRLWKSLAADFPHHRVLNRGFGGSIISHSLHYADRIIIPYQPRMVVFYAGGNDINYGHTAEQVAEDFTALVAKIRRKLPTVEIAFISIAGNPKRWPQVETVKRANALIADFCGKGPHLRYIDVFHAMLGPDGLPLPDIFREDRLHMNDRGYRIWTDMIGNALPPPDRVD